MKKAASAAAFFMLIILYAALHLFTIRFFRPPFSKLRLYLRQLLLQVKPTENKIHQKIRHERQIIGKAVYCISHGSGCNLQRGIIGADCQKGGQDNGGNSAANLISNADGS